MIDYYKINPGGNITAIVLTPVQVVERVIVAQTILKNDTTIEQVGFWCNPKTTQAKARLEMMGGEFCGNATRCLAYLVYQRNPKLNQLILESSGTDEFIMAEVDKTTAKISLSLNNFQKMYNDPDGTLISLPGINHFITTKIVNYTQAKILLETKQLLSLAAAGIIYCLHRLKSIYYFHYTFCVGA